MPRVSHYKITTETTTFFDYAKNKNEVIERASAVCKKFGNTLGHVIVKIVKVS